MAIKRRGVFERPKGSGCWWISYFDADRKRHREKVGKFQAACDAYEERRLQIRQGKFAPPRVAGIVFRDLVAEAFADRRTRLSPWSYATDESRSRLLLEWFGPIPAAKITTPMIAERLRNLRSDVGAPEEERSGATVNRYKALLSAVFTWGVENGKCTENPARAVKGYRDSEKRVRYLDHDEEAALLEAVRRDYSEFEAAEIGVALHTGMRRNEFYRLRWDQVDLERGVLTVEGKAHANSSLPRVRYVPINSDAAEAFRILHSRADGSAYVCPGSRGRARGAEAADERDYRDWFEASVKRAGIENFHYHDLRHTFASRLVMNGVELRAVMEFLGHTTLNMVLRYTHLAPDHQKANIETLVRKKAAPKKAVVSIAAKRTKAVGE
jgi:integrase